LRLLGYRDCGCRQCRRDRQLLASAVSDDRLHRFDTVLTTYINKYTWFWLVVVDALIVAGMGLSVSELRIFNNIPLHKCHYCTYTNLFLKWHILLCAVSLNSSVKRFSGLTVTYGTSLDSTWVKILLCDRYSINNKASSYFLKSISFCLEMKLLISVANGFQLQWHRFLNLRVRIFFRTWEFLC
jgi:hypothetical protein